MLWYNNMLTTHKVINFKKALKTVVKVNQIIYWFKNYNNNQIYLNRLWFKFI